MANIAIFRINYKSDFILTLNSDAGWLTPFCIKFWTGAPSQAYFAGWDGTTYTHCSYDPAEPTKLVVQFDNHHLPIGDLKFQIAYHFTVDDFPTSVEDEVLNQAAVIIEVDDAPAQVMLDLNGETAPELQFTLPAYANEQQRIANEEQRIENEQQRVEAEQTRIANEQTRQLNEQTRVNQETARVNEYAELKADAVAATRAATDAAVLATQKAGLADDAATLATQKAGQANDAAVLATQKAKLADDAATLATQKAGLANDAAELATQKAGLANDAATLANQKAQYAQDQGDYAKAQGDYAKAQADVIPVDVTRTQTDATFVNSNHDSLFYLRQASSSLAGLMTAAEHNKLNDMPSAQEVNAGLAYDVSVLHPTSGVNGGNTYASLSAALAVIPQNKHKGGMTVKFVLTSDNKYVQYRLMPDTFSTTESDWQGVDSTPTVGSQNLVTSGGVVNYVNQRFDELSEKITTNYTIDDCNTGYYKGDPPVPTGTSGFARILIPVTEPCVITSNTTFRTGEVILRYNNSTYAVYNGGTGVRCEVTAEMIANGVTDVGIDWNLSATPSPTAAKEITKTFEERFEEISSDVSELNEDVVAKSQEANLYPTNGYFRDYGGGDIRFVGQVSYRVVYLIPVKVGDIFEVTSSIIGDGGMVHPLVSNDVTNLTQSNIVGTIVLNGGKCKITQQMWELGARFVSFSFVATDEISVIRKRLITATDIQKGFDDINTHTDKVEIIPISETSFKVRIPTLGGDFIDYNFNHLSKTFDSLPYIDSGGNPQTKSNVLACDIWNNDDVYDKYGAYLLQGNTNFIYQKTGETSHTGSLHGCEVMKYVKFFADGVEFNPTSVGKKCDVFEFVWRSDVYSSTGEDNTYTGNKPRLDTDGNPIVNTVHFLRGSMRVGNKVDIYNQLEIKQDNFSFNQLHAAMLEEHYGDFQTLTNNNAEYSVNSVASDGTCVVIGGSQVNLKTDYVQLANIVEMYGTLSVNGKSMRVKKSAYPIKGVNIDDFHIVNNFYDTGTPRLKCYFMPCGCGMYSSNVGLTPKVFNTGDVIIVKNELELNYK